MRAIGKSVADGIRELDVEKQHRWRGFLRAMIALWILISPWVLVHLSMVPAAPLQINGAAFSNFLIVGVVMIVISMAPPTASTVWEGRIYAAMGVWLIASPWVLGFRSDSVLTWNAVVVGVLAVVVSGLIGATRQRTGAA